MAKLRALVRLGEPQRLLIAIGIAVSLIEVGTGLLFPLITRDIIDNFAVPGGAPISSRVLRLLAVIALGSAAASVGGYLLAKSGQRIQRRLKQRLFTRLLDKPVAFFDETESGDLVSRITTDTQVISLIGTKYLSGLVSGILLLVGSAVVLFLLDPALTLGILAIIAGSFLVMAPSFFKVASIVKKMNRSRARVSADLARVYGEVRLVKAMNAEATESRHIGSLLDNAYADALRYVRIEALLGPLNGFALTGAMIAIFTYGAARVGSGAMTIGTLTIFILYIFNIVSPLIQISTFLTQFQTALGSSAHLHDLLAASDEATQSGSARPAPPLAGAPRSLRFEEVEFHYPTRRETGLSIAELEFPAGSKTAIIGPSGGGKTTLFSLIERFYPIDRGRMLYGGLDIADFEVGSWRAKIGYVSQAAPLMSGTIADNILYGSKSPRDEERMLAAAEAANCTEFIVTLEQGFDAQVGESGVLLSAGQKQRIALAAMFYRDPEIILLDEVTANLDEGNEAQVMRSITRLLEGRTAIIIAHRPRMLSVVDRVVVLERGTVTAILTPPEAMAQRDLFERALSTAA